jgi:hypothetical protein
MVTIRVQFMENVPSHEPCLGSGGRPAPRNPPRFKAHEQVDFEPGAIHEPVCWQPTASDMTGISFERLLDESMIRARLRRASVASAEFYP